MPHPSRLFPRTTRVAVIGIMLIVAGTCPALARSYWFENYERAVALIDTGEMADASALLDGVIKEHPLPISCLKVPGDRCIDYIPYFHRARIQLYRGETRAATHSLDVFEAFGTGLENKRTERWFLRMRQQINEIETTRRSGEPGTVTPASDPN